MYNITVTPNKEEKLYGWFYLFFEMMILPIGLSALNSIMNPPLASSVLNFIYFSLNFLCVVVIFHKFLLQNAKNAIAAPVKLLSGALLGYGIYWLLSILTTYLILYLSPAFHNVNDASIVEMVEENTVLMFIGTVCLVPLAEETLFRGLIFCPLYKRNPWLGYAVSTVAFAALHIAGYIGVYDLRLLALCFLQYIPAGIALGYAYARSNTIFAPILIHMFVNLTSLLASR